MTHIVRTGMVHVGVGNIKFVKESKQRISPSIQELTSIGRKVIEKRFVAT